MYFFYIWAKFECMVRFCSFIFFFLMVFTSARLHGQVIAGLVVNEQEEPVQYATIFIKELKEGTITNARGMFILHAPEGNYELVIRSLGYHQIEEEVVLTNDTLWLDFVMKPQSFEIKEVLVFPGKEDPAMYIVRKAMANASYYREKIKHFEADLYIKSNFKFTNIPRLYQNRMEMNGRKLKDVLKEGMTYVIESRNKITYDYPQTYKQEVISKRSSLVGFDEPPVMGLMTSGFYDERPNQVISPLAPQALKHYDYFYEGFITSGNSDVFKIRVVPKRKSEELVSGYMYIVDGLWCLYHVNFRTRIKFFGMRIEQQYENLGNDNWMPVSHLIDGDFSMLGLSGTFLYTASLRYNHVEENHHVAPGYAQEKKEPEGERITGEKEAALRNRVSDIVANDELSNRDVRRVGRLNRRILKEQYNDTIFASATQDRYKIDDKSDTVRIPQEQWDTLRTIPLTADELYSYKFADSLKQVNRIAVENGSDNGKKGGLALKLLTGHPAIVADSAMRLGYDGLLNASILGFNVVDGYNFWQRFRLRIVPDSGKVIHIRPEVGYAFNRKALYWSINAGFQQVLWKNSNLQVDAGRMSRDFKPGNTGISPALNSTASWVFGKNYMRLYETSFAGITLTQKLSRRFSLAPRVEYNHFIPLENTVTYTLSSKREYEPNLPYGLEAGSRFLQDQKSLTTGLTAGYRRTQRKPWLETSGFLMLSDFYNIQLQYEQGIPSILSSDADFSHIALVFHQQANLFPGTGIDWRLNAGTFLHTEQLHFSQFKHFPTAEIPVTFKSFTHTFQLLNDYRPSTTDSYLHAGAEIRNEYLLLRYLALINRRAWSESIHVNYLAGRERHYWEAGYSLNNLFFIGNAGIFAGFRETAFNGVVVKFSISAF